ncbi:MAG: glycosyltransferase family 4 protein [Salinivirgaceae bacterium]
MKKRILILVNHELVVYNFRRELVERLLMDGFDVFISSPPGEKINFLVNLGCHYIESKVDRRGVNPIRDFKLFGYYRKVLKAIKPDVVLSYTIKPNIYGGLASRLLNIPYIANITGLGSAVENAGLTQKLAILLYKIAFKRVQRIFVQNEDNKQFFISKNIKKDRLKILPGSGVNLEQFCVLDYPLDITIEFAFISRIMREKGIEEYIEAAKSIKQRFSNVKFHICGFCEEDYKPMLDKLHKEGIINYHGNVKDIRKIHETVHCIVHPSYYPEGMSNVLLEACASARPVMSTRRAGCREIIDDGVNGFLFNEKDSCDLIEKLENFIALPYLEMKKMGLEARKKVEKEFDRRLVVEAYLEEINSIYGL